MSMVEMEIIGVHVEQPYNTPLMLLRETEHPGRVLPIVIDVPEAEAIGRGLEGIRMARPMTHDLLAGVFTELDADIVTVTVTELRDRTFFAEIVFEVDGVRHQVSSRPSDAIALAVRTDTPVYASSQVLDEAGQMLDDGGDDDTSDQVSDDLPDTDPDELLDEFKQFLDDLNPDDFMPDDADGS